MKKSALAVGLRSVAAGQKGTPSPEAAATSPAPTRGGAKTVLIGGHYAPEVRRALLLVQAKQNTGKNLKQLLGEGINDLCSKYDVPEPYTGEA